MSNLLATRYTLPGEGMTPRGPGGEAVRKDGVILVAESEQQRVCSGDLFSGTVAVEEDAARARDFAEAVWESLERQ